MPYSVFQKAFGTSNRSLNEINKAFKKEIGRVLGLSGAEITASLSRCFPEIPKPDEYFAKQLKQIAEAAAEELRSKRKPLPPQLKAILGPRHKPPGT